jgi:hypothetical protein
LLNAIDPAELAFANPVDEVLGLKPVASEDPLDLSSADLTALLQMVSPNSLDSNE